MMDPEPAWRSYCFFWRVANRLEGTFGAARTASKANLSAEPRQLVAESNPSATRDYFEEILLNLFRRFLAGKP